MQAFEVLVNGKRRCVAGVENPWAASLHISYSVPDLPYAHRPTKVNLRITGYEGGFKERIEWSVPSVRAKDEILIRFIESNEIDAPSRRDHSEIGIFVGDAEVGVESCRSLIQQSMEKLNDSERKQLLRILIADLVEG